MSQLVFKVADPRRWKSDSRLGGCASSPWVWTVCYLVENVTRGPAASELGSMSQDSGGNPACGIACSPVGLRQMGGVRGWSHTSRMGAAGWSGSAFPPHPLGSFLADEAVLTKWTLWLPRVPQPGVLGRVSCRARQTESRRPCEHVVWLDLGLGLGSHPTAADGSLAGPWGQL